MNPDNSPPECKDIDQKCEVLPPKTLTLASTKQPWFTWKEIGLAVSWSNLCLVAVWYNLFLSGHPYFNKLPLSPAILLSFLLLFLCLAGGFVGAFRLVRRFKSSGVRVLADLAFLASWILPLNFLRLQYLGSGIGKIWAYINFPVAITTGIAILFILLRWRRTIVRLLIALCLILLPLALFNVSRAMVTLMTCATGPNAIPAKPPVLFSSPPQVRVVWLVFDELDYTRVFESRPPGLRLPEFDKLIQRSLTATNAYPPASWTQLSIPALICGREVTRARPAGPNELFLAFSNTSERVNWSQQATIFSQARQLGYNTGLVGWFHPYGRLFPSSLNVCTWHAMQTSDLARGQSLSESFHHQIWTMLSSQHARHLHVGVYRDCFKTAMELSTNAQIGLQLLHLPVPHLPGISTYDQRHPLHRRLFSTIHLQPLALNEDLMQEWNGGTRSQNLLEPLVKEYCRNLVVADNTLGVLRDAVNQAGLSEKTWFVVSSDHWFRYPGTKNKYDSIRPQNRVPFIISPPGSDRSSVYMHPVNTVVTHDLILAILREEITQLEDIPDWLNRHRVEPPRGYVNDENSD